MKHAPDICDAHAGPKPLAESFCPGMDGHCQRGEHCTWQFSICAMDAKNLDHPKDCCICSERL